MTLDVHLLQPPEGELIERLAAAAGDGVALSTEPGGEASCDVLVGGTPSAEQLDASPRLRALVIPYAGLPRRTRELLLERPGLAAYNIHHNAVPSP